jgi:hypothetical protein
VRPLHEKVQPWNDPPGDRPHNCLSPGPVSRGWIPEAVASALPFPGVPGP